MKNQEPAFPCIVGPEFSEVQTSNSTWQAQGLSVRDYFAAKAMQAFLTGHVSHYGHESHWKYDELSSCAFEMADAMLLQRNEISGD